MKEKTFEIGGADFLVSAAIARAIAFECMLDVDNDGMTNAQLKRVHQQASFDGLMLFTCSYLLCSPGLVLFLLA